MSADAEIEARAEVGRTLGLNAAPNWQEVRDGLRRADKTLDAAIETGKLRPVQGRAPVAGIVYNNDAEEPGYGTPDIAATTVSILARVQVLTENSPMHRGTYSVSPQAVAIVQAIVELIAQGDR